MIFIDKIFPMKNDIIMMLLIVIIIGGGILYFYKDSLKHKYNTTAGKVKATLSHAAKQVKEDIK
jgi:hypothetical protein